MKIYVHDKGIVIVGKAWEVRQKLIEYRRQYELLKEWLEDVEKK